MSSTHVQTFRYMPLKHTCFRPSYCNLWLKTRPSSDDVVAEDLHAVLLIVDYISPGELPHLLKKDQKALLSSRAH
ncbi:hypothetical protein L218DRAFT_962909 [Marasmius fiardii PR-910]|nr:hypothetical protein L218DRAFT_962909 [Marasmius fiardii PR-910]